MQRFKITFLLIPYTFLFVNPKDFLLPLIQILAFLHNLVKVILPSTSLLESKTDAKFRDFLAASCICFHYHSSLFPTMSTISGRGTRPFSSDAAMLPKSITICMILPRKGTIYGLISTCHFCLISVDCVLFEVLNTGVKAHYDSLTFSLSFL